MKFPTRKKNKLPILLTLLVVALLIGGVATFLYKSTPNKPSGIVDTSNTTNTPATTPTTSPSTPTPVSANPTAKDTTASAPDTTGTKSTVSVVIVDASQYGSSVEVRAYADGVDAGSCTITFSKKGAPSISRTVNATAGAKTSSCETTDIPSDEFNVKGNWDMSVSYKGSTTSSGLSPTKTVTVQ